MDYAHWVVLALSYDQHVAEMQKKNRSNRSRR